MFNLDTEWKEWEAAREGGDTAPSVETAHTSVVARGRPHPSQGQRGTQAKKHNSATFWIKQPWRQAERWAANRNQKGRGRRKEGGGGKTHKGEERGRVWTRSMWGESWRAAKHNYKQCRVGRGKRREREGGTWERKILSLGRWRACIWMHARAHTRARSELAPLTCLSSWSHV